MSKISRTSFHTPFCTTRMSSTSSEQYRLKKKLRRNRRNNKTKSWRSSRILRSKWLHWRLTLTTSRSMDKIRRCSIKCTWTTFPSSIKTSNPRLRIKTVDHTLNRVAKLVTMATHPRLQRRQRPMKTMKTIRMTTKLVLENSRNKMTSKWSTFRDVNSMSFRPTCPLNTETSSLKKASKSLGWTGMWPMRWMESRSWLTC